MKSITIRRDEYFDCERLVWLPIPKDENGIYTVDFLREYGVNIISSEARNLKHYNSDGRPYTQKARVDTFTNDQFDKPITFFYRETHGNTGIWPINH
jgi:hypothetical protein